MIAGVIQGTVGPELRNILSYFDAFRSISNTVIIVCMFIAGYIFRL